MASTAVMGPPDRRGGDIPALTGLRFLAALSVALAHSSGRILEYQSTDEGGQWLSRLGPFGMTLFFVLSGFVIHYNYRYLATARGLAGLGQFLWARFARLYPLFLLMLVLDVLLGRKLFNFMMGSVVGFTEILRALPYYLLFVQSWVYIPFSDATLVTVTEGNISLSWSISTEWFFYLAYPLIAWLVLRARHPGLILGAMVAWSLLWGGAASGLYRNYQAIDAWAVEQYGPLAGIGSYKDSFFHWLLYYSPYLRIGEFILGCLTAQLYLQLREHAVTAREQAIGRLLLGIGVVSLPVITFFAYSKDYPSPLLSSLRENYALAPSVALVLFGVARYENAVSHLLRRRSLVALGEASYSIYLTHFMIFIFISGSLAQPLPATLPSFAFLLLRLAFALSLICLISLGLHAVVEVPARRWLRGLWGSVGARRPTATMAVVSLPAAVALLCFVVQSSIYPDKNLVSSGIRLVSATYGASCGAKPGNATGSLVEACNGQESCDYVVETAKLGDPAAGCAKDFTADYACMPENAPRHTAIPAEAGFRSHAQLVCTAGASLQPAAATDTAGTATNPVAPIATAPPVPQAQPSGIDILAATYGGNCGAKHGNATRALVTACNGKESCDYSVEVARLGDPASGCGKDFSVEYLCKPGTASREAGLPGEAGFGGHVLLDCGGEPSQQAAAAPNPAATGIDIVSATYGENCGARRGNATAAVRAACGGKSSCTYVVEVSRLGDPASGCQKDFRATYHCPGSAATLTGEAPAEAGFGASVDLTCP